MYRIIKHIFILLLAAFLLMNCNFSKKRDKPMTFIKQIPLEIKVAEYKTIIEVFKVGEVDKVPSYYGGLSPKFEMALVYTHQLGNDDCLNKQNLNQINEMGEYCMNLIIKRNGKYLLVKSDNDLKKIFAPIENEEEAISYVSIITGTHPKYDFGKEKIKYIVEDFEMTNAIKRNDGFETVTFDYDLFCCPPHKYNLTRCFVDFKGNVKVLKRHAVCINTDDNYCYD